MPTRQIHSIDNTIEKTVSLLLDEIDLATRGHQLPEKPLAFPTALWKSLAGCGLLRQFHSNLGLPGAPPTTPLQYKNIAYAGFAMTRRHLPLGLAMTWIGQLIKIHFLGRLNYHDKAYIESILCGESLCALAISEPDVGAHPKFLSCSATKNGGAYILNGEKAFVSNGPYADRIIVLAITNQNKGRKHFSAFLVPTDCNGLTLLPPQPVNGLQPSSHCNIVFSNCRIPANSLIGTPGQAFEEISLPMRTLEDALMLAPIAGAVHAQLDSIGKTYAAYEVIHQGAKASPNKLLNYNKLGELLCLADSAKELSIITASKLDQLDDTPDLTPLIVGFRSLVNQVQTALLEWHDEYLELQPLANDIEILTSIGRRATSARTNLLAEQFLATKRRNN